jgi:hypothetical protein
MNKATALILRTLGMFLLANGPFTKLYDFDGDNYGIRSMIGTFLIINFLLINASFIYIKKDVTK